MTDSPEKMGVPDEALTKMGLPTRDEIQDWLSDNTTNFVPGKCVTLHSFDVNWRYLKGDCLARVDNQPTSTTIHFY
jgi:hypothetical protein